VAGFEFNIDHDELSRYAKVVRNAAGDIDREAVVVNLQFAKAIRDTARELVPFVTGRLHDSISVEDRGLATDVVADAPYAGFVEFGTVRMAPRPYMRPAFRQHRAAYRDALLGVQVGLLTTRGAARGSFVGAISKRGPSLASGTSAGRARG
jgi:HK97 gp10 family phage protein